MALVVEGGTTHRGNGLATRTILAVLMGSVRTPATNNSSSDLLRFVININPRTRTGMIDRAGKHRAQKAVWSVVYDSTHTFQMFAAAPRRNIDPLNAIPPETVLSHDTVCAEFAENVVVEDRYPDSVPRLDADRCHSLTDASMSGALSKI